MIRLLNRYLRLNLPNLLIPVVWGISWNYIPSSLTSESPRIPALLMASVFAQENNQNDDNVDFQSDGRSGNRSGGGSRSKCPPMDFPLTALVPESNWGKTLEAHPTLWFYVPYSPEQAPVGEFVLQDEAGNDVYRLPFELSQTPGLVRLSVPDTQESLKRGNWYRWYFTLYCDRDKSASPVFAQGWIQRIPLTPTLERQLNAAKPREDQVYVANRIWFDALTHLANLRLANSNQVTDADWRKLLQGKGVNLELPSQELNMGYVIFNEPRSLGEL